MRNLELAAESQEYIIFSCTEAVGKQLGLYDCVIAMTHWPVSGASYRHEVEHVQSGPSDWLGACCKNQPPESMTH